MKYVHFLLLSMLVSIAPIRTEGEEVIEVAPGLLSRLIHLPLDAASGMFSLVQSGANSILDGGAYVVKGAGHCCTKIGGLGSDIGSTVITAADEHRLMCGVVGLTAIALILTQTENGRAFAQRIQSAIKAFLGLNEEVRCRCNDHRALAMYLNQ